MYSSLNLVLDYIKSGSTDYLRWWKPEHIETMRNHQNIKGEGQGGPKCNFYAGANLKNVDKDIQLVDYSRLNIKLRYSGLKISGWSLSYNFWE